MLAVSLIAIQGLCIRCLWISGNVLKGSTVRMWCSEGLRLDTHIGTEAKGCGGFTVPVAVVWLVRCRDIMTRSVTVPNHSLGIETGKRERGRSRDSKTERERGGKGREYRG